MMNKITLPELNPNLLGILVGSLLGLIVILLYAPYYFTPLLIGLLPFVIYVGLVNPDYLSLLLMFLILFRLQDLYPMLETFKLTFLLTAFAFFSFIFNVYLKKIELIWLKEMTYFVIFFSVVTVGVFLSFNFKGSFEQWSGAFVKIALIYFLISWSVNKSRDFNLFIYLMVLGGCFISLIILYNKINGIELIEGTRASIGVKGSMISDPNDVAYLIILSLSFAYSLFFSPGQKLVNRLIGIGASILIISAIIATQSRGGLLGVCGVTMYFLSFKFKSRVFLVCLAGAFIIGLYTVADISDRESGGGEVKIDDSSMNRIVAWTAASKMAVAHPLFGVGLGQFQANCYLYSDMSVRTSSHLRTDLNVHSSWFNVLSESGFLGFTFFILCLYSAFRITKKNIQDILQLTQLSQGDKTTMLTFGYGLQAALIGACIAGSFLTQGFGPVFYVLFAMSIAYLFTFNSILKRTT